MFTNYKLFVTSGKQNEKVAEEVTRRNQGSKFYKNFQNWDKLDRFALPTSRLEAADFVTAPKWAQANYLELVMRPALTKFMVDLGVTFPFTRPLVSFVERHSVYSVGAVRVEEIAEVFVKYQRFEGDFGLKHGGAHVNGILFVADYGDRVEYQIAVVNSPLGETTKAMEAVFAMVSKIYAAVQYAVLTRPEEYHYHVQRPEKKDSMLDEKRKEEKNQSSQREVELVKHVYSDQPTPSDPAADSSRSISCEAWGVSGHWRHYKSVKVVWVKPYVKGKSRNNPEKYSPKIYKVLENAKEVRI